MADRFVAVDGSPTNPGTIDAPWPLAEVLGDGARKYAQPGDTVHVRGGTYRHPDRSPQSRGFRLRCKGNPAAPITIRAYRRERATVDGGITANFLDGLPEYVDLVGLEILVAELVGKPRISALSGSVIPTDLAAPWGGVDLQDGKGLRIINNVIRANIQGIGLWKRVAGATVYGNIIHDNGYTGPDRNHGHAMYTQCGTEERRLIANNIIFDAYQSNLQAYGSSDAPVQNYDVEDNVFLQGKGDDRVLIGGNAAGYPRNCNVRGNWAFDCQLILGYNTNGGPGCVLENNLVPMRLDLSSGLVAPVIAGNFSPGFITDGGWPKQLPGNLPVPTTAVVKVTPNAFDPDRVHIGFYNPTSADTVSVALSGLNIGDSYAIHRPDGLWDAPALSGVWTGQPIALPTGNRKSGAYVLFVDRDPCAATKRERDELAQYVSSLAQELAVARLERDQAREGATADRAALRQETSARLELAQRVDSLETQLSAAQSQKALLQTDLTNIGIIADKWR